MTDLASKAMLVSLHIRRWGAEHADQTLSDRVARSQEAQRESLTMVKKLVPDHAIADLKRTSAYARNEHLHLTMPGFQEGQRLLPSKMFMRYTTIIGGLKEHYMRLVGEFCEEYPNLLEAAPRRLGKAFRLADYPRPDRVAEKFGMEMKFFPVPDVRDWRMDQVDQATIDELRDQAREEVEEVFNQAHRDVMNRIREILTRVSDQAKSYKPGPGGSQLRDPLFRDLREMGEILPLLNVSDDPVVNDIAAKIREDMDFQPSEVRANEDIRSKLAAISDKLLERANGG